MTAAFGKITSITRTGVIADGLARASSSQILLATARACTGFDGKLSGLAAIEIQHPIDSASPR